MLGRSARIVEFRVYRSRQRGFVIKRARKMPTSAAETGSSLFAFRERCRDAVPSHGTSASVEMTSVQTGPPYSAFGARAGLMALPARGHLGRVTGAPEQLGRTSCLRITSRRTRAELVREGVWPKRPGRSSRASCAKFGRRTQRGMNDRSLTP